MRQLTGMLKILLTACRNCIIYINDSRKEKITYKQMQILSNKFGDALRRLGVKKGDRVFIFLPGIPELYIALAGCAKIGAIIAPLDSSYRDEAVKERMLDGQGKVLVTTSGYRKHVPADELPDLEHVIIVDGKNIRFKRRGCFVGRFDGRGIRFYSNRVG